MARRVPLSASELVHTKAQLLLQNAELTASLAGLDYEIAQLHSVINALKVQEATEDTSREAATARIWRLMDEMQGSLIETASDLRQSSVSGIPSYEGLRERVGTALELQKLEGRIEKQHRDIHGLACGKCKRRISGVGCPICFANN